MVTNPEGSWLRADNNTNAEKYGILSTGQLVIVDKVKDGWAHIVDAEVEDSDKKYSGWAFMENLTFVSSSYVTSAATTTKATTAAHKTTTVKKTTVTAKTTTATKATTASKATTVKTTTVKTTTAAPETSAATTTTKKSTAAPANTNKAPNITVFTPGHGRDVMSADAIAVNELLKKVESFKGAWFITIPDDGSGLEISFLDGTEDITLYYIDEDRLYADVYDNEGYIMVPTLKMIQPAAAQSSQAPKAPEKIIYKVTSTIGCRVRSAPDTTQDNTIWILNYEQEFEVEEVLGEWVYANFTMSNGTTISGYVHYSVIARVS